MVKTTLLWREESKRGGCRKHVREMREKPRYEKNVGTCNGSSDGGSIPDRMFIQQTG